ncbi:MAG: FKBP-type peptidyl-prolyl cis-trans isomerase [Bacteriovoracaceae bacterium]|nr:FKBP-type peptidyl-prolyl cis-trans isomerase [Bacteriovoracaceae bacterium]
MEKKDFVSNGDTVTISYTGKLDDGTFFSSSKEDGFLQFKVGEFELIKGLNDAVLKMKKDEEKTVTIEPQNAFGERDESLLVSVPRDDLQFEPEIGLELSDDNTDQVWVVRHIDNEKGIVIMDGNHILAGHVLVFDIKIQTIE